MTDKVATVKLRVTPERLNELPAKFRPAARKIEDTLSGAIKQWITKSGRDLSAFGGRIRSTFSAIRRVPFGNGMLSALNSIEVKALSVARKIKNAFREAYSGRDAQGRFVGRGVRGNIGAGAVAGGMLAAEFGKRGIDAAVGATTQAAGEANRVQEAANRISIGARQAGGEYVDPEVLAAEFFAVAKDVKGITAEAAADAAAKFVSLTGDLATVRSSLKDFGVAATASGAEIGDVAEAVASITTQFGVTDPGQVKDVLAALIYQGKGGSFELKDAAALFQKLAAAGAAFGLDKSAKGVKTLGGLTQLVRAGTGSGEQAATGTEALLTKIQTSSGLLRQQGVNVYDKQGKIRDVSDILIEAISKVGGTNTEKKNTGLQNIFDTEAMRGLKPLIAQYQSVFASTAGDKNAKTAAAVEALRQKFDGAINAAGSWTDVMQDSERAQSTNTAKLTSAWQTVVSQVSDSVTPALTRLVDEFSNNPDAIRGFTDAIIFAGESLGTLADWVAMFTSGQTPEEYGKTKAAREARGREQKAARDLAALQMSPEQIAKLEKEDPEKLGKLRAKATLLQIRKESAGGVASQLEQEVLDSQSQHGSGAVGEALTKIASWFESNGPDRANVARKMGIDGVVQARIVNPNDLKQAPSTSPSGGAPTAPGYTRGG